MPSEFYAHEILKISFSSAYCAGDILIRFVPRSQTHRISINASVVDTTWSGTKRDTSPVTALLSALEPIYRPSPSGSDTSSVPMTVTSCSSVDLVDEDRIGR